MARFSPHLGFIYPVLHASPTREPCAILAKPRCSLIFTPPGFIMFSMKLRELAQDIQYHGVSRTVSGDGPLLI